MAEFKRLGKRGSYRFGRLRVEGPAPKPLPVPRQPTFRPNRSPAAIGWWVLSCAVAAAVLGAGAWLGLWWLPFLAGVAAGLISWRARWALAWAVVAVAVGWGVTLWLPAILDAAPAGATARVIAALAGLPPYAAVGVAFTLLAGWLQAVAALWLTRAIRPRSRPGLR
jgi:hypothetical protein